MRTLVLSVVIAAAAFGQVPRPEFPEPQFERADWQTLNGAWQFAFDDANAGLDAKWWDAAHKLDRSITVPYCFESKLSGIGDTGFHPWVWYRREVAMPTAWQGKRLLLHFGAVDYQATVWVNGQMVGQHEGGNVPFALDVTPVVKSGANVITVRAWDPPTDKSIPRGKQYWETKSKGIFYTRTSGIWQPVWLEATGDAFLERAHIKPDPLGSVTVDGFAGRAKDGDQLRVRVLDGSKEVASGIAPVFNLRGSVTVAVPGFALWTLESPKLYEVALEVVRAGAVVDRVKSYFGFRTVETRDGRFLLNGKPVYLKMILDQGYWPESILTPPTDEAIVYDIRMTKAMGFNGARKHQKVEDPRFLYWADRMGFLVSGEMANSQGFDAQYVDRFTREWTAAVLRDINHPSVVIWAPLNESWGTPDLRDPRQQEHLKSLYSLTHSLDGSRPTIDNEGWQHTDKTDLFAIHDYTKNGPLLYDRYKDIGRNPYRIPDNGRPSLVSGYEYNGSPLYLSEFGGIAFIPDKTKVPSDSWGYSGVEPTAEAALARLESIYQGLAKLPRIMGICYTQLTDVEQEVNGLMTYDRKMKFDAGKVKALNDLLQ